MKLLHPLAFFPFKLKHVQARLDSFRIWYNEHRCHQSLGGRRPEHVWNGQPPIKLRKVLARDLVKPHIDIRREHHDGDPFLQKVVINVRWPNECRKTG